jgi:hypothetical protein
MKIVIGIAGAVIGAIFGLLAAVAFVRLLSHGNTLAEGFLLVIAAPLGILTGAITGALIAVRVFRRLRERPTSATARVSRGEYCLRFSWAFRRPSWRFIGLPEKRSSLLRIL